MTWDVFISYASEDKLKIAQPLAEALKRVGIKVWFDQFELKLGDSLRRKIDEGLNQSTYGIVILSHYFFSKHFTNLELDGLAQRETDNKKVILPIWYDIEHNDVKNYSNILADRFAVKWSEGIDKIVDTIKGIVLTKETLEEIFQELKKIDSEQWFLEKRKKELQFKLFIMNKTSDFKDQLMRSAIKATHRIAKTIENPKDLVDAIYALKKIQKEDFFNNSKEIG